MGPETILNIGCAIGFAFLCRAQRQQPFPPQGDEPLGVKKAWMERPQAHGESKLREYASRVPPKSADCASAQIEIGRCAAAVRAVAARSGPSIDRKLSWLVGDPNQ